MARDSFLRSTSSVRERCPKCLYPISTCVCMQVEALSCRIQIDILQHPSEVSSAKNTARLIPLCIPSANIWVGDVAEDFLGLTSNLSEANSKESSLKDKHEKILVLYPHEYSTDIKAFSQVTNPGRVNIPHLSDDTFDGNFRLILLDGTWKKSYRLWMNNPWLKNYQAVHISGKTSKYYIRKSPNADCLSTLEALAFTLNVLDPEFNTQPLLNVFLEMQSHFFRRLDS